MSIAIGGVGLYNKAKFDAAKRRASFALPRTVKDNGGMCQTFQFKLRI
jgi:hypothetical protein